MTTTETNKKTMTMSRFRAAVWTLVALGLVAAVPSASAAAECSRVDLPLETYYGVSAAQTADGRLVLLDFLAESLVVVDLDAGGWGVVDGWAGEELKGRRPVTVRAGADGILLEQESPAKLVRLDETFGIEPETHYAVNRTRGSEGHVLESMWTWEPVDGDLVACADLYSGGGSDGRKNRENWYTGFVRFPLASPADFRVLLELDLDDRTALGCRLAMPLIASVGDRVYLLDLADVPRILVSSPERGELRPLDAFPERFAFMPTSHTGFTTTGPAKSDVPFVFRTFEESTMPAGLFGWEGQLYLLSRSPAEDGGGTDWWLTRIDPQTETVVDTVRIASRAPHLMAVPGADHWAFIEKGPVDSFEDHELRSVLVAPAEAVRELGSEPVICGRSSG